MNANTVLCWIGVHYCNCWTSYISKTMYEDHKYADIPASESLSIAFNTANTAPIPILSCAADNKWWSRDVLNENFSAEEWSWDMRSVDSSRSRNNRWHVNLAPGSASWFSTPNDRIINNYTTRGNTSGGLKVNVLDCGSNGLGSSPGRGQRVVFLGRTLHCPATVPLLHSGVF